MLSSAVACSKAHARRTAASACLQLCIWIADAALHASARAPRAGLPIHLVTALPWQNYLKAAVLMTAGSFCFCVFQFRMSTPVAMLLSPHWVHQCTAFSTPEPNEKAENSDVACKCPVCPASVLVREGLMSH